MRMANAAGWPWPLAAAMRRLSVEMLSLFALHPQDQRLKINASRSTQQNQRGGSSHVAHRTRVTKYGSTKMYCGKKGREVCKAVHLCLVLVRRPTSPRVVQFEA